MAHDSLVQLQLLLKLLDNPNNDIYLHIDKKSSISKSNVEGYIKQSTLYFFKKYSVYWADISQTKCQFFLLKKAVKRNYDYYHLLSGHDLPLKNNDVINDFFEHNQGKEFIHFESQELCEKENCLYYHFLFPLIQRVKINVIKKSLTKLEYIIIRLQKKMGVKRKLYCGANWFSITNCFAKELSNNSNNILRKVRWTISSDEYAIQTFYKFFSKNKYHLYAKTISPTDYKPLAREIDWIRGGPYVWRLIDYDYLMNSESMFARKFNWNDDKEIILKISQSIMKQ